MHSKKKLRVHQDPLRLLPEPLVERLSRKPIRQLHQPQQRLLQEGMMLLSICSKLLHRQEEAAQLVVLALDRELVLREQRLLTISIF